ncbi:MAG: ribosome-associated translation inhibitor RaiA [Opitutaceae bacterium]|nr:ribosome-associated translation inhibitor RaiA [Opitutaceae bacterium]
MTSTTFLSNDPSVRLILRGVHLWLTDSMKTSIRMKADRLFRHEPRIIRMRISVSCDRQRSSRKFTANGLIEMRGPDLSAAVTTENAYHSVSLLIDKLDRMLRKRTTAMIGRRSGDIREHPASQSRSVRSATVAA